MSESTVKRIITTVLGLVVTALIGLAMNLLVSYIEKPAFKSEYEHEIKQCIVHPESIDTTLDDVGGLVKIKKELKNTLLLPLKYPKFFQDNKLLKPLKGVLFHGPPGTGKTLLAKSLAKDANVPLIALTASSLESKWFGESNKLISSTFNVARSLQPCIIFFDEIDGIGKTRSDFDQSCVSTFKTELLSQLDGINNKRSDTFIVIACTNNIKSLDPALKRRLPNHYEIELPNVTERKNILSIITKNEQLSENDIYQIAHWTSGYSGSDLESLYQKVANNRFQKEFENDEVIKTITENININYNLPKIDLTMWKEELKIDQVEYNIEDDIEEAPS